MDIYYQHKFQLDVNNLALVHIPIFRSKITQRKRCDLLHQKKITRQRAVSEEIDTKSVRKLKNYEILINNNNIFYLYDFTPGFWSGKKRRN